MKNIFYFVKPGDSLRKVARKQLGDENKWREISENNNLSPPYVIYPGQKLLIPVLLVPTRYSIAIEKAGK